MTTTTVQEISRIVWNAAKQALNAAHEAEMDALKATEPELDFAALETMDDVPPAYDTAHRAYIARLDAAEQRFSAAHDRVDELAETLADLYGESARPWRW